MKKRTNKELKCMYEAGKQTYFVLDKLKTYIKEGITTLDIENYIAKINKSSDCKSAFLNYEGFPYNACISVNDTVVHGFPDNYVLKSGDIVKVDYGNVFEGYYSDSAYTYIVGNVSPKIKKFVEDTQKALYDGLNVIKDGVCLNEVSKAIEKVALDNGYGIVKCLSGHGIGKDLHEDPYVLNYSDKSSMGIILKEGNTIAVEPMFTLGSSEVYVQDNGWGIKTIDRSYASHFEHTIVVTKDGYKILTGE